MLTIYLHTKLHMPRSNGSLGIAVKMKAKDNFRTAAMLFYILQNNHYYKSCNCLLPYILGTLYLRKCRSHFTSSRVRHVVITDCRKSPVSW
jgi:hypothetical protein